MINFFSTLPQCTVAMEACASAHFFGAKFKSFGHEVRLIAPHYVKPFVKSNKNDAADAEAIAEAAVRPNMHFVPIKGERHMDIQAIHRVRERLVKGRTALCNEMRGILGERGLVFNKTIVALLKGVRDLIATHDQSLTPMCRQTIVDLLAEHSNLEERISAVEERLKIFSKEDETCKRLQRLGLTPLHSGTGGKNTVGRISKRGDSYIRCLLIHGARSIITRASNKSDQYSQWVNKLRERRGYCKTAVACANKNARIIFSLLKNGGEFKVALASHAQV